MLRQPFSVIFEDEGIIAVNKAAGIAVSADRWDSSEERLDRIIADTLHPGSKLYIVHRIDKDTSGLVLFAKNPKLHRLLSRAFETRQVQKRYIACVHGRPSWKEADCDLPLVPNGNKRHMTIVDKYQGKKSLTNFAFLGSAGNYSILECLPETGRTHQIRVHLAALGHSVVCDELYGKAKPVLLSTIKRGWRGDPHEERPLISRLGLHAAELFIPDYRAAGDTAASGPAEGLTLKAPLPRDMAALIRQMEKITGKDFGA